MWRRSGSAMLRKQKLKVVRVLAVVATRLGAMEAQMKNVESLEILMLRFVDVFSAL
jgi:hypothetical protein